MGIGELFVAVQEACEPAVWSQGVLLTRGEGTFIQDSASEDEILLRVILKKRPVSPRVTLALKDLDWSCDCGNRSDPCPHVAGAVIAVKRGSVQVTPPRRESSFARPIASKGATPLSPSAPSAPPARGDSAPPPYVSYRFRRAPGGAGLLFERWMITGQDETKIGFTLQSVVAGSQSGRLPGPKLAATKADFAVDHVLYGRGSATGPLDRRTLSQLIAVLADCPSVTLDGKPVQTSTRPAGVRTRLIDDGAGYRLQRYQVTAGCESFGNGVVLDGDTLRPVEHTRLTPQEENLLANAGQYYPPEEGERLVTEILPALQRKTPVEVLTKRLPKLIEVPPRLVLRMEKEGAEGLSILPQLVYGDPPVAQVNMDNLQLVRLDGTARRKGAEDVVLRNTGAEQQLVFKLRRELTMQVGRRTYLQGTQAVRWVSQLKGWPTVGDGYQAFLPSREIQPRLEASAKGFTLRLDTMSFEGDPPDAGGRADPARFFRAWREGADYVPLIDGGWAPLPTDWLRRYGKRIQQMLNAKDARDELPAHALPELAALCEELGEACPDTLQNLRRCLDDFTGIPAAQLPEDLTAQLRPYQRKGVDWLSFLRDSGLGALLADDMGLGKTLQTICALRGRTLVVAPTSVLRNWEAEIRKFRPGLRASVYYGAGRALDPQASVTLTTYALLRLDLEKLAAQDWDTIVLDEAQTIKNPESQVARAAHRLHGKFRVALSGTPVENRLDDLWSQMRFTNPGLLGERDEFADEYASPINRGDERAALKLRNRIKPFILRRLKRTVAPELPPRTETVLRCELSPPEREVYESILAATRQEVMAALEEGGGGVMQALEALLRLRQACCHPALIPGQRAEESAKVNLLLETLEESLAEGHRSLVFSQWTSYLDLIQSALKARGIEVARIDGSTQNRQEVVEKFQRGDGPSIMLISLKAGGTGLTLTAADHVFIMDPWWNPAVEDQAADRAHRIGQQNPVLIHRLVAQESVEERILLLQEKKKELAKAVLDGGGAALSLTRDDLLDLLRP